jgi:hypothetical protein
VGVRDEPEDCGAVIDPARVPGGHRAARSKGWPQPGQSFDSESGPRALIGREAIDRHEFVVEGVLPARLQGQPMRASGVCVLALAADACLLGHHISGLAHLRVA